MVVETVKLNYSIKEVIEVEVENKNLNLVKGVINELGLPFGFYKNKDGSLFVNPKDKGRDPNLNTRDYQTKFSLNNYNMEVTSLNAKSELFVVRGLQTFAYVVKVDEDFNINYVFMNVGSTDHIDKNIPEIDKDSRNINITIDNGKPSMRLWGINNSVDLNAKLKGSEFFELKLETMPIHAYFGSPNPYKDIVLGDVKKKESSIQTPHGNIGGLALYGESIENQDSKLFVLGNEFGHKKNKQIDYIQTIKKIVSTTPYRMNELLSFK